MDNRGISFLRIEKRKHVSSRPKIHLDELSTLMKCREGKIGNIATSLSVYLLCSGHSGSTSKTKQNYLKTARNAEIKTVILVTQKIEREKRSQIESCFCSRAASLQNILYLYVSPFRGSERNFSQV